MKAADIANLDHGVVWFNKMGFYKTQKHGVVVLLFFCLNNNIITTIIVIYSITNDNNNNNNNNNNDNNNNSHNDNNNNNNNETYVVSGCSGTHSLQHGDRSFAALVSRRSE